MRMVLARLLWQSLKATVPEKEALALPRSRRCLRPVHRQPRASRTLLAGWAICSREGSGEPSTASSAADDDLDARVFLFETCLALVGV